MVFGKGIIHILKNILKSFDLGMTGDFT